jgi:hypothetical protein
LEQRRLSLALEISPASPANTYINGAVLGECTELLTAPYLPPVDDLTYLPPVDDLTYLPPVDDLTYLPPTSDSPSSSRGFFIQQSSSRGLLIGNHEAEIFKELYKIEEEVIRERATGKFKELYKIEEEVGVPGTIPGGFLAPFFPSFLGSIFTPFLGRWRSRICLYMDVSGI